MHLNFDRENDEYIINIFNLKKNKKSNFHKIRIV